MVKIPWGDLYRRGYHRGITHLHHLYTRRNLIVLATLWRHAASFSETMRDALRFWLLSYNSAHATIMARVVAKSNQNELVVTSAQPGVLYVSGLPVEKNLLAGLRRKLATITNAFTAIHGREGRVEVRQRSSCHVALPDHSIDYVFTDPPFGGNIPYAEVNFVNEAWLGRYTERTDEVVISPQPEQGRCGIRALAHPSSCGDAARSEALAARRRWHSIPRPRKYGGRCNRRTRTRGSTCNALACWTKRKAASSKLPPTRCVAMRCCCSVDAPTAANPPIRAQSANPWQVAEQILQDASTPCQRPNAQRRRSTPAWSITFSCAISKYPLAPLRSTSG